MAGRVRVVVVDYDGGELTMQCLTSLVATDWPRDQLEIVLVDNGSRAPIVDRVRNERPEVRIVRSEKNLGFGGGCNLGFTHLDHVDFVALVNNDATVEPGWLEPLVATLEADPSLGAASPKILFTRRYVPLEITSEVRRAGGGDRRDVGVRVSGTRVDGRDEWRDVLLMPSGFWGPEPDRPDEPGFEWTAAHAEILVPVASSPTKGELRLGADRPTPVTFASGAARAERVVRPGVDWYDAELTGEPFDVINNVGTELVADGYGADRGYLDRDAGQFDEPDDVFAWSGGAVLLRASYLSDVGRFDERLFLYCEDLELAWRGTHRGWRYRYVPQSVVRHVHSATAVDGSPLAQHYKERNHLAVLTRHASWSLVARAIVRYLLVTASYFRRDVVGPLVHGRRPRPVIVNRRLRAFLAYLRLAPAMLLARRGRATRRV